MKKQYLHLDLDAFFASVELLDHPEWKNLPVIVGGKPEDRRSVVSTASYEARKYGVHSAMPTVTAVKLCPNGIFVHPRMERYLELSEKVMEIFKQYSPDVQQISIDEAFIDLTGTEKLFGPADKTAKKIKAEVLKKTGLTVSVGLATTKYLAKIASEIKKPDGFFEVPEGFETSFMLSLPLKKVWGIGEKTLLQLNKNGIKTTEDLFQKPKNLLVTLFGEATGNFLYNAVRGQERETFNQPPKTRSLSAENTYSWSLTESFAIDTALLELCHTVIRRMHKDNVTSCTAFIKIRYDDFSTITVQETSERYITSLDELFERVKRLFYKKADISRGIRLLGVGLQNTKEANDFSQGELFDFGEEKKRKVEEAIFKTEKKLKGVKITRARLLNGENFQNLVLVCLSFLILLLSPQKLHSQTKGTTEREADGAGAIVFDSSKLTPQLESKGALFNYKSSDSNVEFNAEGYWKTFLTGGWTSTFGYSTTSGQTILTPIFSNQVDLNLFFLLDKKYYFEASFADNFDTNTVALGYYGDNFLKEARVSNRGISFPSTYSIEDLGRGIGGGKNLAPGLSLHFEKGSWTGDFALRYENLESKSKTWYGKNSVSTQEISLEDFVTGFQYILPSKDAVLAIKNIYVESSTGSYLDKNGRKYKLLNSSQYLLSASSNSIFLSKDAKAYKSNGILPSVALEYDSSYTSITSELGSWGSADSPGLGFLGETQAIFKKDLEDFALPLTGEIDGKSIYYIQYPSRFSPYATAFRYDAGIVSSGEASILYSSTKTSSTEYSAVLGDGDFTQILKDFFSTSHTYAEVFDKTAKTTSSPEYRFPFAQEEPGAYLGYKTTTDLVLAIRTYTSTTKFEIGLDAVEGSVRAYKNGIQDSGAKYDSKTGTVSLSTTVTAVDRIVIQWYEDSSNPSGTLVAAGGINKTLSQKTKADFAFSTRWTVNTQETYSRTAQGSPGYINLAGGLEYKGKNFSVKNVAGLGFEQVNTSGKFLVSDMDEENTKTSYLAKDAAVSLKNKTLPSLNPRKSGENSILLTEENDGSQGTKLGILDEDISGYAIPVEWDFSSLSNPTTDDNPYWSAISLSLPGNSNLLASATSFTISIKKGDLTTTQDFNIYLQLGVEADSDEKTKDENLIPTWQISSTTELLSLDQGIQKSFDQSNPNWQEVTVFLKESDRALLSTSYDARIIITSKENKAGQILIGPYKAEGIGFSVSSPQNSSVFSSTKVVSSSNYAKSFEFTPNTTAQTFVLTRYFDEMDFSDYELFCLRLNFFTQDPPIDFSNSKLEITLDRQDENGNFTKAISLSLEEDELQTLSTKGYCDLEIDLINRTAKIAGSKIQSVAQVNSKILATRLKISYMTDFKSTLELDKMYFSESKPYLTIQDKTKLSLKKDGEVIKKNGLVILSDLNFQAEGGINSTVKKEEALLAKSDFLGRASSAFTLTSIKFQAEAAHSSSSALPLYAASHSIKTAKPILSVLTAEESFSFKSEQESLEKTNALSINLSPLKLPANLSFTAKSSSNPWGLKQEVNTDFSSAISIAKLQAGFFAGQNLSPSSSNGIEYLKTQNYAKSWKEITALAFDSGDKNSSKRDIEGKASGELNFFNAAFAPKYSISAQNSYKNSSSTIYSDTLSQNFSLPFTIKSQAFNLSWTKTSGGISFTNKGGNYQSDIENLNAVINSRNWYFSSLPIHDLISEDLSRTVLDKSFNEHANLNSLYYTSLYSLQWKRKFLGTTADFFIPSNALLAFERDIKTSSSISDIYQLKANLSFFALNVFGKKSALRFTDLFEQDEYTSSFSVTMKIPRKNPNEYSILLSFYQQDTFYIRQNETLRAGFEFSFEDKNNLSGKTTFVYKRPGKKSFLESTVKHFSKIYSKESKSLSRSDSLNISLERALPSSSQYKSVTKKYGFDYSHLLDIRINSFAELNTNLGLSYTNTVDSLVTINATGGIGATIKF